MELSHWGNLRSTIFSERTRVLIVRDRLRCRCCLILIIVISDSQVYFCHCYDDGESTLSPGSPSLTTSGIVVARLVCQEDSADCMTNSISIHSLEAVYSTWNACKNQFHALEKDG